jgi:formylmethanofuran dehydrogenase subunit E
MAATFVNIQSGKSVRVLSTEESRDLAAVYAPELGGESQQQLMAYCRMPDSVLFRVQQVRVRLSSVDLPGPTRRKICCERCGQVVRDGREVVQAGVRLCGPCSEGAYFSDAHEATWPNMEWTPGEPPDALGPYDQREHRERKRTANVIAFRNRS